MSDAPDLDRDEEPLAGAIRGLWERGRAAWPELGLDPGVFARHVRARCPAGLGGEGGLNAADLYLACACAQGDAAALQAFDRTILEGVPAFVAQVDPSPSFADEVRQLLRTRLLLAAAGAAPRIAEYAGTGALRSWVRVIAARTALSLRRNRDDLPTESLDAVAVGRLAQDPALDPLRAQCQAQFRQALREAFTHLSPDQRNLLRLSFAGGLTGEAIAAILQVNRTTVVRGLAAARSAMFHETRRLLRDRLRLPPVELDSFLRLVRSQLDLSLTSLLREEG